MKKSLFVVLNILIVGCSTSTKIEDPKNQLGHSSNPIDKIVLSNPTLSEGDNSIIRPAKQLTEEEKVVQDALGLFPAFSIKSKYKYIATTSTHHYYLYTSRSKTGGSYVLIKLWLDSSDPTKIDIGNVTHGTFFVQDDLGFIIKDSTATDSMTLKNGYNNIYIFTPEKGYFYNRHNQWFPSNINSYLTKPVYYLANDSVINQLKLIQTKLQGTENNKTVLTLYSGDIDDDNAYAINLHTKKRTNKKNN